MLRCGILLFLFLPLLATAQHKVSYAFKPIDASGFNQDVIAENAQVGAVASTTIELDAITPSNFVLFSRAFAKAKGMEPGLGLPDNGRVTHRNKVYQLKKFNESNALYLTKGAQGVLSFSPVKFEVLSLLGLATEGKATFSITFLFSDGTSTITSRSFPDWFDGPTPVMKGIGRVKRENVAKPFYEGGPENPRLYEVSIEIPEGKVVRGMMIRNITGGEIDQSNRVVILALSGYNRPPIPIDENQETEEEPEETIVVETLNELETRPVEVGVHISLNSVLFKQSTAVLLDQSYSALDSVSSFLIKNPSIRIEVAGHTDAHGHAKANLTLSRERAVEIKKYLVKKGVVTDRIIAKGYGGSRPIAPNDTEEHRRLNRRVEFVILSK